MKPAHVCLIEVVPKEGCELDPNEIGGAFIRCYVAADTVELARGLVVQQLETDRFHVERVEWCVNGRTAEWEKPDDEDAEALMRQAETSGDVVYGRVDAWDKESDGGEVDGAR